MGTITKLTIADAIETTLGAAASIVVTQSADELTEAVHVFPLLRVYPVRWEVDIASEADRSSFGGGIRQTELVFWVDVYVSRRSDLITNMRQTMITTDEIDAILDAQGLAPSTTYFGNNDIKAFHWFAELADFEYGGTGVRYIGARYTITIEIF